ncbi:MAG: RDD family protein [Opitutae bacterium]|nr:RDD family protein [Opitutae bacterium]
MKKQRSLTPFALLLLALTLALGPAGRAQETTPAPTPPAEKTPEAAAPTPALSPEQKPAEAVPVPPPAPVVATPPPAPVEQPATEAAIAEKVDEAVGKIAQKAEEQADRTIEKTGEKISQAQEKAAQAQEKITRAEEKIRAKRDRMRPGGAAGGDRVRIMDDVTVPADMTVKGDAVAVMGDMRVDGEVQRDAVAVMGDNVINGHVHRNAVAVMGDLTLGPTARVDGDIVSIGGEIHRDPGAVVGGEVHVQGLEGLEGKFTGLNTWWGKTLRLGRPLAIGAHLGWLWILTGFSVAFYALLALLFPQSVRRCGDKLVQEPGLSVLAAVLSLLAFPVLFILLCITIIGIPIALFLLPIGGLLMVLFGKAAIYALVGRKITGDRLHLALATILGALVFIVLYLFPVLGLLLSLLVSFVGFGAVMLTMFSSKPKPAASAAVIAPVPTTPMPAASAGFVGAPAEVATPVVTEPPGMPPVEPAVPPVIPIVSVAPAAPTISAVTLPRAGFWIRVGAAFLDFMIIVVPLGIMGLMDFGPGILFLGVAAYHATMWKHKGTTIGGVICGLKVVRLDDRPIDWGVAMVRALTAFLSFIMAGLGFIWVAFDNEKQSWHDKVAGTTIVRVPKGASLL